MRNCITSIKEQHNLGIDEALDTITEYIKFCVDCVATKKDITFYPNNKSYITRELKDCINWKKMAFWNNDRMGLKSVQRELNQSLREARRTHRDVIEQSFVSMDSKKLWFSMKAVTNMTTHRKCLITCDELSKANKLNDLTVFSIF